MIQITDTYLTAYRQNFKTLKYVCLLILPPTVVDKRPEPKLWTEFLCSVRTCSRDIVEKPLELKTELFRIGSNQFITSSKISPLILHSLCLLDMLAFEIHFLDAILKKSNYRFLLKAATVMTRKKHNDLLSMTLSIVMMQFCYFWLLFCQSNFVLKILREYIDIISWN